MNRREFLFGAAAAAGAISAFAANDAPGGASKPAQEKVRLRIAHLTDPQFGFGPGKSAAKKYAADLARFEREIEIVNDMKPDLALITGDLTNNYNDVTKDWPRLLGKFKVPLAVAPGNHDLGNSITKPVLDRYLSVFGYDYKAFDVKGWHIIVGNTQFWRRTDLVEEKARYEAWLKEECKKAKAFGGRVLFAGHIPPFADKPNEGDTYENYPKAGRTARMEMYRATGARFFLAGHTHRFIAHGWKDLTILNPETTSTNFDSRPHGFRLFDIADKYDYSYNFVKVR